MWKCDFKTSGNVCNSVAVGTIIPCLDEVLLLFGLASLFMPTTTLVSLKIASVFLVKFTGCQ